MTSFRLKICFKLIVALFAFAQATAQTFPRYRKLNAKLNQADSIILISHIITAEHEVRADKRIEGEPEKEAALPNDSLLLFIKGKLNERIVTERISLPKTRVKQLSSILLKELKVNKVTPVKCDQPHHSVVIYKNNRESYLDICFGCERIHSSPDIQFSHWDMNKQKWDRLLAFFKKAGIFQFIEE